MPPSLRSLHRLTWQQSNRIYEKMADFDRTEDVANIAKHGISLARWSDLEIRAIVPAVEPVDYGDPRYRARVHRRIARCFVFTTRNERYRPISLRRDARNKRYV